MLIPNANVTKLIPLYAFGVFVSFTLSQGGMVKHWLRLREPGWLRTQGRSRNGNRGRRRWDRHCRHLHVGARTVVRDDGVDPTVDLFERKVTHRL